MLSVTTVLVNESALSFLLTVELERRDGVDSTLITVALIRAMASVNMRMKACAIDATMFQGLEETLPHGISEFPARGGKLSRKSLGYNLHHPYAAGSATKHADQCGD